MSVTATIMSAGFNSITIDVSPFKILAKDLTIGKRYPLEELKRVTTQYGDALIAFIEVNGEVKKLYLPKAYCTNMSDEEIAQINEEENDLICAESIPPSFRYEIKGREKTKKQKTKK